MTPKSHVNNIDPFPPGSHVIGGGAYSKTYCTVNGRRVRKVMRRYDAGYTEYAQWLQETKTAEKFPFFPRILACYYADHTLVFKMERLEKLGWQDSGTDAALSKMRSDLGDALDGTIRLSVYSTYDGLLDDEASAGWIRFIVACAYGEFNTSSAEPDIHNGNVMFRENQLVLTDPLSTWS